MSVSKVWMRGKLGKLKSPQSPHFPEPVSEHPRFSLRVLIFSLSHSAPESVWAWHGVCLCLPEKIWVHAC
jgi:hypothetical protein